MATTPKSDRTAPTRAKPAVARWHFPVWLIAAWLAAVTIGLYWPSLGDEFLHYDDDLYVTENVHVRTGLTEDNLRWAFTKPVTGNWHPLTMISHMVDAQFFGLKPWGHHLTSVLVHAFNTVLVFLLLRRLTGTVWRSALVAALFGWHPTNVESVAWIAERKNVLSLGFGLLTLLFYVRYAQNLASADRRSERRWCYGCALFCFALGLMCKSILVTWPAVFFLLDYWPLGRFRSGRWSLLMWEKIPFAALVGAVGAVTILTHRQEGDLMALGTLPLGARAGNALISYCRYLGKLFWPVDLAAFYPHPGYWPGMEVLLATGFLTGATLLAVALRRRLPFLLMGWLWFLVTLLPVIGLVQVGDQAMADRHMYIPAVGIWIMTVWSVFEACHRWLTAQRAAAGAGLLALGLCLVVTRRQLQYWQNDETLFQHALAVTQNNFFAHGNLGMAFSRAGRTDEAIDQFQQSLRLEPNVAGIRADLADALARKGQIQEAINEFQETIRRRPNYANAHFNFANLLLGHGRPGEAIAEFRAYLRLVPGDADAHSSLGFALLKTGQTEAAISEFEEALRLKPMDAGNHYNLGFALLKTDRIDDTISQLQESIRLQPDCAPAHYNLAVAFSKKGQTDLVISEFAEAVRLQPDYVLARDSLGMALAKAGRLDEAIKQFQAALQIKPDDASAQKNLDRALAFKNQMAAPMPESTKP